MRKLFGLDPTMLFAERVARITISLSLLIMMLVPVPLIFIIGPGPFAFLYPLFILPGFYTLRGTCKKINLFHYLFLFMCISVTAVLTVALCILPVLLFCFMLYFQAERRLYYLLEMKKSDTDISDDSHDLKAFCKVYLVNCCKNAIVPTVTGSIIGVLLVLSSTFAWYISAGIFLMFLGFYFYLLKSSH